MASASPSDTVACALEVRLHGFKVGMQIKTANTNSNGAKKAKNGRLTGVEKAILEAEWKSPAHRAGPGVVTLPSVAMLQWARDGRPYMFYKNAKAWISAVEWWKLERRSWSLYPEENEGQSTDSVLCFCLLG